MISIESHSRQIKLLNEFISALQSQNLSNKKEVEEAQKSLKQSIEENQILNSELGMSRKVISQLNIRVHRGEQAIKKIFELERLYEKQQQQKQNSLRQLYILRNNMAVIQTTNNSQIESNKSQIQALNRNIQRLQSESEAVKQSFAIKEQKLGQKIAYLQDKKKQLQDRTKSLQINHETVLKNKNQAINKLLQQLQSDKNIYDSQISKLRDQIGQSNEINRRLKLELANLQIKFTEYESAIGQKSGKITEQTEVNTYLKQQINRLNTQKEYLIKENQGKLQDHRKQIQLKDLLITQQVRKGKSYCQEIKSKEAAISNLKAQLEKNIKEKQILQKNYQLITKEKEKSHDNLANEISKKCLQVQSLSNENTILKAQLQKQLADLANASIQCTKTKQSLQNLQNQMEKQNQNYKSFKEATEMSNKKKQIELQDLYLQIKELQKKNQKKGLKIQQLNNEIKQLEKLFQNKTKNLDSTQRQEFQRLKLKYQKELTEILFQRQEDLKKFQSELKIAKERNDQLTLHFENSIKKIVEQTASKEKLLNQANKAKSKQIQQLQQNIRKINDSLIHDKKAKNAKEYEIEVAKKNFALKQNLLNEQAKRIEKFKQMLQNKEKQIESLQESNKMLRKQLVQVISNEEQARKEVLETRSRTASFMMNENYKKNDQFDMNQNRHDKLSGSNRITKRMLSQLYTSNVMRTYKGKGRKTLAELEDDLPLNLGDISMEN